MVFSGFLRQSNYCPKFLIVHQVTKTLSLTRPLRPHSFCVLRLIMEGFLPLREPVRAEKLAKCLKVLNGYEEEHIHSHA
jgi:hypothetical protein